MDDLYLDGAPFFFYFPIRPLRALVAALGISDEVDRLGLKGSKKKRSKKLDEDWMVIAADFLFCPSTENQFTANSQASGSKGGTKGYPSHAANSESQGSCQVAYPDQGWSF